MTEYSGEGDTLVFASGMLLTIGAWNVVAESGPPESWSGDLMLNDFVDWAPDQATPPHEVVDTGGQHRWPSEAVLTSRP